MIKRTLYFGNPAYLSLKNSQLVVKIPNTEGDDTIRTIPIEDIGFVILDNPQITITHGTLGALVENNTAVVTCNDKHMPAGLLLPSEGNTTQSERYRNQIEASLPLRKQIWQQTIQAKIRNQAAALEKRRGKEFGNMLAWADDVRSGDSENLEARAAVFYWDNLFAVEIDKFRRDPDGDMPNSMLNYGYAILRAIIARALVGSGLLPTLGVHHRNRYNAYCLADDIMEPYRPYVDLMVCNILDDIGMPKEINRDIKARLLTIPTIDVMIDGKRSPLMIAASQTTASLARCYAGEIRKVSYPEM
ncbi:MAG: type II CRISPR-associated endonuclease Cas1 [Bacteroidales bacterium]|nr:type II CRISPR-associated endonuclease Cas1 [Bacteroidales bacterium]